MVINIDEIPADGKALSFDLDINSFSERLSLNKGLVSEPTILKDSPKAELFAEVRGVTVILSGKAFLKAEGICSRCGEGTEISLSPQISMVLKPKGKSVDEFEDLNLGFYEGKEINLNPIVEEQLILGIPYKLLCKDNCRGLCINCGENLNLLDRCQCAGFKMKPESKPGTFMPFADLKSKMKM